MANKSIVPVEIKVDASSANKSVGSLKQQLREAQNEVANLSDKFGATSKEAIEAAKRAAELKDRIGDAKALTDAFNPDAKFKALTSSLSGVAGAFAAVQGSIGLLGVESAQVEKTILKVQSALALSQGLQAVGESIDSFKQLGAVIKSSVAGAFTTLRSAIISTGIGALVIGVGLLIANFDKVKETLFNLFPGLTKLSSFVTNLVQKFTDFVGITSESSRQLDTLKAKTDRNSEAIQNRIKILQAQGNKEKEIYQLSKTLIDEEINLLRKKAETDERLTKEEQKRFRDLKVEKQILDAAEQKRLNDIAAENARRAEAERQKRIEDEKRLREQLYKDEDEATKTRSIVRLENKKLENLEELKGATVLNNELVNLDFLKNKEIGKINNVAQKNQKDKRKVSFDSEVQMAAQTLSIIGGLVDQNSAAGKGIAVAQAIINTYQGASKAIAQGGIFGPVAAAATIAAGLIQVKKIVSTKVPSATGGNVADKGISVGGPAPIAPTPSIQATLTQLDQSTVNRLGSASAKAYVVESDITSSQEKISRINRAARLS